MFATSVALDSVGGTTLKVRHYIYSSHHRTPWLQVWHLVTILALLAAIAVGFTSRSTRPPPYHNIFAVIGFVLSIVWIYVIANELVSLKISTYIYI